MQPLSPEKIEELKAEGTWEEYRAFVREIGNYKIDPGLIEGARTKMRRAKVAGGGKTLEGRLPSAQLRSLPFSSNSLTIPLPTIAMISTPTSSMRTAIPRPLPMKASGNITSDHPTAIWT
jgi:hypothetical protein